VNSWLRYWVIPASLAVALMLTMLPLPAWAQPFRPDWVALILIYWNLAAPNRVGLWYALISGLIVDVAQGTLLGQHALALVIIIYVNSNLYQRVRVLSWQQQSLYVLALLFIDQLLIAWVEGIMGRNPSFYSLVAGPVVGMIIWPLIFVILRDIRRKAMLG